MIATAAIISLSAQNGSTSAQGAAQSPRTDAFVESLDHPAVAYSTGPVHNAVADLNDQIRRGTLKLSFEATSGYLRAVLSALQVPIDSQTLVFSQGSLQARQITPANPRAVYFNDTVAVGWVRGADVLELAAHDARQGTVFYTLRQEAGASPRFERDNRCLECHLTWDTLGVPGFQVLSTFQMSDDPNAYAAGLVSDHRTPFSDRWGGWYVTGRTGTSEHRGNVPVIVSAAELQKPRQAAPQLSSVAGRFDTHGLPSEYSDVVALMVLEHQSRMANLLTRVGWETRVALSPAPSSSPRVAPRTLPSRVIQAVDDLVDYLLFVDEAPLPAHIVGSSGFAERFAAMGPKDSHGRSLRQLDLDRRLFRYPCSYMIYTPAFDALMPEAKRAIYERLWAILSGEEHDRRYTRLSAADRRAIIEILRDTKPDLPASFRSG